MELRHISSKIERSFEKRTKSSIKIRPKRTIIRQLKGPYINVKFLSLGRKITFFCKNVLIYTITLTPLWYWKSVLANFFYSFKMMSRNNFWLLDSWLCWPVFDSKCCLFFQIFAKFSMSFAEIGVWKGNFIEVKYDGSNPLIEWAQNLADE